MASIFNFQDLFSGSPEVESLKIRFSIVVTLILVALQCGLLIIRPFVQIKYIYTQIIYACTPVAITTSISLLYRAPTVKLLNPIRACLLTTMYGAIVNMSSCNIGDNGRSIPYILACISPLIFYTVWLASNASYDCTPLQTSALVATVLVCAIMGFLAIRIAMNAFYLTSKSKGLPGFVEPTVRHMRESRDMPESDPADPTSMLAYLVWHDPAQPNKIITTADIWRSVGISYLRDCTAVECLKDLCLSYAFFKLILTRFADYHLLHQRSDPKTRRFVREGLLSNSTESAQRLFCIIELELNFLFKFFYAMDSADSLHNFNSSSMQFFLFVCFQIWIFTFCVFTVGYTKNIAIYHIVYAVLLFAVGVYKIDRRVCSNWSVVGHLCTGLSKVGTDDVGSRKLEKLVAKQCTLRESNSWKLNRFGSRTWQRKLGQYAFLESYGEVPFFSRQFFTPFSKLVKLPRVGQAGDFKVPLSDQVKQQIIKSLLRHVQDVAVPLSRGSATIASQQNFSDAWGVGSTDAHVILTWHIATSICESLPEHRPADANDFLVATQLSKYCAYLLVFALELLPDNLHATERFFDMAVQQAQGIIIQDKNVGDQYRDWFDVEVAPAAYNDNVIARGALLAQALIHQVMVGDPKHGWRFLAEFWAELLLYLAPSDKVLAHGEYLARGGEFITHIWALLTHAGIVTRWNAPEDSSTSRSRPVRVRRRLRVSKRPTPFRVY